MRRIKITIAYDGTAYNGWQKQNNATGIQEKVEKACESIFGEPMTITGASRTDTGVHAFGQVATFETDKQIPTNRIPHALNAHLPDDIVVHKAEEVHEDFHPRYNAKKKTYRYVINQGEFHIPQYRFNTTFIPQNLDMEMMQRACKLFEGEYDFKGFCSTGSSVKTTVRTIYSMDIQKQGSLLVLEVTGNGFLYNMVRIIAGTLIEVGKGKRDLKTVEEAILQGDRNKAGVTAPAKGLTLMKIYY